MTPFAGFIVLALLFCSIAQNMCAAEEAGMPAGHVNVKDFSRLVVTGDWSPAIQAAIDHVSAANGYEAGATVFFPPGTYKLDKKIVLGKDAAQYGTQLSGYGAVLVGTKVLDEQPLDYERRSETLAGEYKTALSGELDYAGKDGPGGVLERDPAKAKTLNVGNPILELWNPPETEGAAYVIEGLTFDREASGQGVGIKVPAETVPKNITFRDVKVYRQNVGVHINYCWQIRFESCIIRGNQTGVWGRNHFNSVSIINSTFRRNHYHGLVIGPNAGTWGSSGIHIAGSIFEANKGYGILNVGGALVTIIGNYFEANGNSVGVFSPYGHTTIDTNHFWAFYGHGWKMNRHQGQVVSGKAHVIVDSTSVQLRNNRYHGDAVLVFGLSGRNSVDALPVVAEEVDLTHGAAVPDSSGIGVYVYDAESGRFALRPFSIPPSTE